MLQAAYSCSRLCQNTVYVVCDLSWCRFCHCVNSVMVCATNDFVVVCATNDFVVVRMLSWGPILSCYWSHYSANSAVWRPLPNELLLQRGDHVMLTTLFFKYHLIIVAACVTSIAHGYSQRCMGSPPAEGNMAAPNAGWNAMAEKIAN